jgi:hypothetical protein
MSGDIMNSDDRERLARWLAQHPGWFAGFQEDPALPKSGFRMQGDVLFISGELAKMLQNPIIPSWASDTSVEDCRSQRPTPKVLGYSARRRVACPSDDCEGFSLVARILEWTDNKPAHFWSGSQSRSS